jgi:type II secretory pathway component PulF
MAEWQAVFNPLYLNLVRLGEATGTLPTIFSRLAEDIKFQSELRQRVSQALVYPGVILFVCVLCILFVFNYIVPQMSGLFDGMPEIPFYTEMLLSSSEWVIRYQWLVFMGIFFASFLLMVGLRDPNKARRIDGLVMRLPGLSKFITLTERIRFNTAIALTLESGVLIDRSLEMAVGSVKNRQLKAGLILAKDRVKKGDSLSRALATSPIYDEVSLSLVEVGEESGELGAVFGEISSRSRREFESSVQRMTSLLEPALILVMGGIVGGVVVVMLLSIVSVNDVGF